VVACTVRGVTAAGAGWCPASPRARTGLATRAHGRSGMELHRTGRAQAAVLPGEGHVRVWSCPLDAAGTEALAAPALRAQRRSRRIRTGRHLPAEVLGERGSVASAAEAVCSDEALGRGLLPASQGSPHGRAHTVACAVSPILLGRALRVAGSADRPAGTLIVDGSTRGQAGMPSSSIPRLTGGARQLLLGDNPDAPHP